MYIGDAVELATKAAGIERKSGCGCAQRHYRLNSLLGHPGDWAAYEYPAIPPDWTLIEAAGPVNGTFGVLYRSAKANCWVIKVVIDGRYRHQMGFCGGGAEQVARTKFACL